MRGAARVRPARRCAAVLCPPGARPLTAEAAPRALRRPAEPLAQCARCMYAYCTLCLDSWHPGRLCLGAEERGAVLAQRLENLSARCPSAPLPPCRDRASAATLRRRSAP